MGQTNTHHSLQQKSCKIITSIDTHSHPLLCVVKNKEGVHKAHSAESHHWVFVRLNTLGDLTGGKCYLPCGNLLGYAVLVFQVSFVYVTLSLCYEYNYIHTVNIEQLTLSHVHTVWQIWTCVRVDMSMCDYTAVGTVQSYLFGCDLYVTSLLSLIGDILMTYQPNCVDSS